MDFQKAIITTLIVVIAIAVCVRAQNLFPSNVFYVRRSSGLINFIKLSENELSSKCGLVIPTSPPVTINLNEYLSQAYQLASGERIQKTASDLCGVRLNQISDALDNYTLDLHTEYTNGTTLSVQFIIHVEDEIENTSPVNITITPVGSPLYYNPYESRYLEFEDEYGFIYSTMSDTINFEKTYFTNTWKGRGLVKYQMAPVETIYNIIHDDTAAGAKYSTLTAFETNESLIFQCVIVSTFNGPCYARKPNRSIIHLSTGLSMDKYSSYDSEPSKGICSIEIRKPYDKSDRGIWHIVFAGLESGCIFSIDGDEEKKKRIDYILSTANSPIQLDVDVTKALTDPIKLVTINCEYPGEIEYCILRNPDGGIENFDTSSIYTVINKAIVLGKCPYSVYPMEGQWICSIKSKDSQLLKTVHYQMNTYNESYITTDKVSVKKFVSESVELKCQTRFNYKLEYCIFENPEGLWYSLSEKNSNEISRLAYSGRGLRYGDCGIEIANIQQEDFGNWTCHIKVDIPGKQYKHDSIKFSLDQDEIVSSAVAWGLGIAFSVIALGLLMGFIYSKFRARQNRNYNNSNVALNETHS